MRRNYVLMNTATRRSYRVDGKQKRYFTMTGARISRWWAGKHWHLPYSSRFLVVAELHIRRSR